jgi:hypothetical protein
MNKYEYERQVLLQQIQYTQSFIQSASERLNKATNEYIQTPSLFTEYNKSNAEASLDGYRNDLINFQLRLSEYEMEN